MAPDIGEKAAKKLAGYLLYVAGCMHHPALAQGL
jgi:hypothetical protein